MRRRDARGRDDLDVVPPVAYLARMHNHSPSHAEDLWAVHRAALGGVSSATKPPLPTTLDKAPKGAQAAHHAMVCYEALVRGEPIPAAPSYLDPDFARDAESVARQHAADTLGRTTDLGPPDDPTPPPPPDKLA